MHGPLSHFCNHRNNFACDLVKLCACKQNHMPLLWLLLPVHWEAGCNGISQGHVPLHRCTCGNDHPRLQQPHMEMCWLVRFMEPWEQPPISIVLLILTYRTADFFSLYNLSHSLDSCRIMWVTCFSGSWIMMFRNVYVKIWSTLKNRTYVGSYQLYFMFFLESNDDALAC